jgi:GT2 family glycosyltransferase
MTMRVFVIIPTIGRAECVVQTVRWLGEQTRRPDGVVVVGVRPEDIAGLDAIGEVPVETALWEIGSCAQRNRGLDLVAGRADIALFLDDDFVPLRTYVADMIALFEAEPDLVGVTGRMIADGIHGAGIGFDDAVAMVRADVPPADPAMEPRRGLYGCNMGIRLSAADGIRFDERLKQYGWQEDIDYSFQVGQRGRLVKHDRLGGVHMGIKRGRTPGVRFGYSQIANPVYLLRKRTIPQKRAWRIMWRNFASNVIHSLRPEPYIDRRGRLRGNLIAIGDVLRGRSRPERITEL